MKKFVIKIELLENVENEGMDSLFLKKSYEVCSGIEDLLKTMEDHYLEMKDYIEMKLKES